MGHKSVRAAQREIDSREFAEWMVFDRINPIGGKRLDWNSAVIASTIANVFTTGKRSDPADFLLDFGANPERKGNASPEAIEKKAMLLAERINRSRRKKK